MERLQQTKELRLSGIFLLLVKQSNGGSFLNNLNKKASLMALQITTKSLFDLFTCPLFVNMYIPLSKFIILIGFGDKKLEKNIFLQVCYYFNTYIAISLYRKLIKL
jgi:hypothetical protein